MGEYFQLGLRNGKEFLGKGDEKTIEIIREGKQKFIHLDNAYRVNMGIDSSGITRKINTPIDSDKGIDILTENIETFFQCTEETEKNAENPPEHSPHIEIPQLKFKGRR